MATSPMRLDQPPPQSPDVTSQTGGSPIGGVAQMIAKRGQQPGAPPGDLSSPHPQGAILAQFNAVKKVLEQMAKMEERMAPFCNRAIQVLQDGVGQVTSAGKPGPTAEAQAPGMQSNRPAEGEGAKTFPG